MPGSQTGHAPDRLPGLSPGAVERAGRPRPHRPAPTRGPARRDARARTSGMTWLVGQRGGPAVPWAPPSSCGGRGRGSSRKLGPTLGGTWRRSRAWRGNPHAVTRSSHSSSRARPRGVLGAGY
ncbi:hypothetical protein QJS66_11490 [Kocuria rhizophila]|nr:hypothetical protein QJS66_11490 [Kocuria rhizophila]